MTLPTECSPILNRAILDGKQLSGVNPESQKVCVGEGGGVQGGLDRPTC